MNLVKTAECFDIYPKASASQPYYLEYKLNIVLHIVESFSSKIESSTPG